MTYFEKLSQVFIDAQMIIYYRQQNNNYKINNRRSDRFPSFNKEIQVGKSLIQVDEQKKLKLNYHEKNYQLKLEIETLKTTIKKYIDAGKELTYGDLQKIDFLNQTDLTFIYLGEISESLFNFINSELALTSAIKLITDNFYPSIKNNLEFHNLQDAWEKIKLVSLAQKIIHNFVHEIQI